MKNETERLKLRQKYRDKVNPILAEKHVPKNTYTFTDDYVFWLEEQIVKNIEVIPCCKSDSEQLCDHPVSERADIVNSSRTYCLKCSTTL